MRRQLYRRVESQREFFSALKRTSAIARLSKLGTFATAITIVNLPGSSLISQILD